MFNRLNKALDAEISNVYSARMVEVKQSKTMVGMRPTEEDLALLKRLGKKLGVADSSVLRLALRALAEKEGVAA